MPQRLKEQCSYSTQSNTVYSQSPEGEPRQLVVLCNDSKVILNCVVERKVVCLDTSLQEIGDNYCWAVGQPQQLAHQPFECVDVTVINGCVQVAVTGCKLLAGTAVAVSSRHQCFRACMLLGVLLAAHSRMQVSGHVA